MPRTVEVEFAGERLVLTPDPAVLWPAQATAFVADVHLGKSASFRAAGVPVPEAATGRDLQRLTDVLHASGTRRLVILGDLVHAPAWKNAATRDAFDRWRRAHQGIDIVCVLGNHDRAAGCLPEGVRTLEEPSEDGALTFVHDPAVGAGAGRPALAGHLHPVVRLQGRAGSRVRARCFWRHGSVLILPAFGTFTGGHPVRPNEGDGVWATGDGAVVGVPLVAQRR